MKKKYDIRQFEPAKFEKSDETKDDDEVTSKKSDDRTRTREAIPV
jgi:hypothetical protein